jgi:hypothetical protein
MEDWTSIREFARRTDRTHHAVQKAIESGRIPEAAVRREGGRLVAIEYYAALNALAANTDPVAAAKGGKMIEVQAPQAALNSKVFASEDLANETADDLEAADRDPHGYYEARAKRERFAAKSAELDYLRAIGELISKTDQREVSARRYKAIRDNFLNIPDRICANLAAERDAARVHAMLTEEIKRVLNELSESARTEVARGTAERVAA